MIWNYQERFPPGAAKKLTACNAGPLKVLKQINPNVYVIDLPPNFEISSTFNISDLVVYKYPPFNPDNLFVDLDEPIPELLFEGPQLSPLLTTHAPFTTDQIDSIKDDRIISTRDGDCKRYLVRWKGDPESDDAWINRETYTRLAPSLLKFYESHSEAYSIGLSSFHPRSIDRDITPIPLCTYQRHRHRVTSALFWP